MKIKLHKLLGWFHEWEYGEPYEQGYAKKLVSYVTGEVKNGGKYYKDRQRRTCKLCGKVETLDL